MGQNRIQFGVKFFIFALVYLLLDLEILLTFPFALSGYINDVYGLFITLMFIIIITIGFIFELGKSALKIDSRQAIRLLNIKSSVIIELTDLETSSLEASSPKAYTSITSTSETSIPKASTSTLDARNIQVNFRNLHYKEKVNRGVCVNLNSYLLQILRDVEKELDIRRDWDISTSSVDFNDMYNNFIRKLEKDFSLSFIPEIFGNDLNYMQSKYISENFPSGNVYEIKDILEKIDTALFNISLSLLRNLNLDKLNLTELNSLKNHLEINLYHLDSAY